MTDRPNLRTWERDLRNIATALRGAAGGGPAQHPDALHQYARRIDEWADAHVVMGGGIGFLVAGAVGGLILHLVMFAFLVLGRGWGALVGVMAALVLASAFTAFAKLRSETDLRKIAKGLRGAAGGDPAPHPDALREYARRIDECADAHGELLLPGSRLKRVMGGVTVFLVMALTAVVFQVLGRGWNGLLGVVVVAVVCVSVGVAFAKLRSKTRRNVE